MVDFAVIVGKSFKGLRQLMLDKKIKTSFRSEETALLIQGDEDQLTQVVINLLSNAIKFCDPQEGTIDLLLKKENEDAVLYVKDNGIGIDKENEAFIFEKFAQVSTTQFGKPKGTGLGLTICKEIIDLHQGQIIIGKNEGKGACFIVRIPIEGQGKVVGNS